jgi:hypothetical protein
MVIWKLGLKKKNGECEHPKKVDYGKMMVNTGLEAG